MCRVSLPPPAVYTEHRGERFEPASPSEVLPLFIEPPCKVTLRTKLLPKAAHALGLASCVQGGVSRRSRPCHLGPSCIQDPHGGPLCLPPHSPHLGLVCLAALGTRPPQQAGVRPGTVSARRWAQLPRLRLWGSSHGWGDGGGWKRSKKVENDASVVWTHNQKEPLMHAQSWPGGPRHFNFQP